MKLKELMERASKGKFSAVEWRVICDGYSFANAHASNAQEQDANAQLIAHTLNTYMDLVEALEDMLSASEYCEQFDGGIQARAEQAIERANNVEES